MLVNERCLLVVMDVNNRTVDSYRAKIQLILGYQVRTNEMNNCMLLADKRLATTSVSDGCGSQTH